MGSIMEKFKNLLLGTDNDEDVIGEYEYENEEYEYEEGGRYEEEAPAPRGGYRREPVRERGGFEYIDTRRRGKNNNVINFRNTADNTEFEVEVIFTYPKDVQDATLICDHVRADKVCVVNLEGIERDKSQRIADFLGGASFALNGDIQRISNEIFMIAPPSVRIVGDLKDEIKGMRAESHILPWVSSK